VPPAPLTRHPQGLAGFFMPEIIFNIFCIYVNKIDLVSILFVDWPRQPQRANTGFTA
jgi:hypothetical protein